MNPAFSTTDLIEVGLDGFACPLPQALQLLRIKRERCFRIMVIHESKTDGVYEHYEKQWENLWEDTFSLVEQLYSHSRDKGWVIAKWEYDRQLYIWQELMESGVAKHRITDKAPSTFASSHRQH